MARQPRTIVAACGLAVLMALSQAAAQPRKPVQSVDDLPRFSYRISGSVALARLAGSYGTSAAWFRAHGIRVVNMSWWDRPSNYEDQLEKNGIGKDAEARKRLARHYFTIERDALYAALKSAPDILFVTIAGNNNSDTGQNIGVYADGYQVESVVPGGARVRLSGTSMAAPAVTNLAAKLLAVDPALTPVQLIDVMERNADRAEADDIKLLNPRRSLAAVQGKPQVHL